MRRGQHGQTGQAIGRCRRQQPRDRATPVVSDEVHSVDTGRVHQGEHIALQFHGTVVTPAPWPGAIRIPALIRRQGSKSGSVQQRRHLIEAVTIRGKAMQQHNRRCLDRARVGDVESETCPGVRLNSASVHLSTFAWIDDDRKGQDAGAGFSWVLRVGHDGGSAMVAASYQWPSAQAEPGHRDAHSLCHTPPPAR
jgi:hypothetical protein